MNDMDLESIWALIKILAVIGCIIAFAIYWHWYVPEKCPPLNEVSTPIYSLDLGNKIQGSFLIGIGNIEQKPKYYFYKMEQDGMILETVSADYTVIIERDDMPRLIHYEIPREMCKENTDSKKDVLIVPYGTIKKNFDVNTASLT